MSPDEPGGASRTPTWRGLAQNALLLVVSLVASFAVLEVGVRLLVDSGVQRWPVHDIREDKKISFVAGSRHTYETDEFRFTLATNRYGRRDVEWPEAALADTGGILFVGDSLVLGYGVEHEDTIASQIEAMSAAAGTPREVFNFGLPGGSPTDYLALLDEALLIGVRARSVLVGIFVGNDFYPGVVAPPKPRSEPREPPPEPRFRSRLLEFLKRRVSQSPRMIGLALTAGRIFGFPVYDTAGSYVFLREQTPEQQALFREILGYLGAMKQRCDEHDRTLYAVAIPNKIQVENAEELSDWIYDAAQPNRQILEYCDEIGIACLDLLPVLTAAERETGERLYFAADRHLTDRGSSVAARAIFEFLEREERYGWKAGAQR